MFNSVYPVESLATYVVVLERESLGDRCRTPKGRWKELGCPAQPCLPC